ncbi:MAG: helix-turn-helix domain-containing protein [Oscillospiraceae bacterium]|nr:helix-turn-helix domain-containing protein [Oscillospiraceae bacterium]
MKRIKILREARGLSQQRLAIELNVSQAMISKYELGQAEPDIQMICNIAQYFGVSADYLLELSDDKYASAAGLSETEKEILFDFKRLDDVQKGKLQAYLQGLLQK